MRFGLKNGPSIFSHVMVGAFKDFIHKFLEVYLNDWYLNDWTLFTLLKKHMQKIRVMLDRCRQLQISLNLKKCIFYSLFVVLLGHIVYKDGLIVDPEKLTIIINLVSPTTVKQLQATLGHIGYYWIFMHGYA